MKAVWLVAALLLLSACAAPFRYYGDYSTSYYYNIRRHDRESRSRLKSSLERVFAKSTAKEILVPPGLYCEYALLLLEEERPLDARRYLELEKQNWPESAVLVEHLISRYELGR